MDGAGNDFVVVDLRGGGAMTEAAARHLGDRRGPFGCDQIIGIANRDDRPAMLIWNADGSEAGACGNAARCVAELLMTERSAEALSFGSPSGTLDARRMGERIAVDMGRPRLRWDEIPLSQELPQTLQLPVDGGVLERYGLTPPVGVSMGNPHAVFFVANAEAEPLASFGPLIEHDALFPDRVNCSVASIHGGAIRLRTWERGVGLTMACGTAACASLVAAHRIELLGRSAKVVADGGELFIAWDEETGRVEMAGPTRMHRRGVF
nr:diaminopimelate epimerase [Parvularcula maris]